MFWLGITIGFAIGALFTMFVYRPVEVINLSEQVRQTVSLLDAEEELNLKLTRELKDARSPTSEQPS